MTIRRVDDVTFDPTTGTLVDNVNDDRYATRVELHGVGILSRTQQSDGGVMFGIKHHASDQLGAAFTVPVEMVEEFCAAVRRKARETYEESELYSITDQTTEQYYVMASAAPKGGKPQRIDISVGHEIGSKRTEYVWTALGGTPFMRLEDAQKYLDLPRIETDDYIPHKGSAWIKMTITRVIVEEKSMEIFP